jgi:hypothetical protein
MFAFSVWRSAIALHRDDYDPTIGCHGGRGLQALSDRNAEANSATWLDAR